MTFLDENGESKIGGFDGSIVGVGGQQEVFWLEVSMHDAHEVADMNDVHDLPHHRRRLTL